MRNSAGQSQDPCRPLNTLRGGSGMGTGLSGGAGQPAAEAETDSLQHVEATTKQPEGLGMGYSQLGKPHYYAARKPAKFMTHPEPPIIC